MPLKKRLEEELQDVVFSREDQDRLKGRLVAATKKPSLPRLLQRVHAFWNGSVEIPLPAAIAVILVLGLGLWTTYSSLFAIDPTTATLLLKVGGESFQIINQGVSVL